MATRIIEYSGLVGPFNELLVIPAMNQTAVQAALTATTSHQESAAFNGSTRLVCIDSDEAVHVAFGPAPVATANDVTVQPSLKDFFFVHPGDKVSIVK